MDATTFHKVKEGGCLLYITEEELDKVKHLLYYCSSCGTYHLKHPSSDMGTFHYLLSTEVKDE